LWKRMNSASTPNPFTPCGMFPGASALHLTPSGTAQGADLSQPSSSGLQPACFPPMWCHHRFCYFSHLSTWHRVATLPPLPPGSSNLLTERATEDDDRNRSAEDDDYMTIHDDDSKIMFVEFNPESSTWDPPEQMIAYLEKHFNKNLGRMKQYHLRGLSHAKLPSNRGVKA